MMQSFIQLDQHYLAVKEVALEVMVTEPINFDSKTLIHSNISFFLASTGAHEVTLFSLSLCLSHCIGNKLTRSVNQADFHAYYI